MREQDDVGRALWAGWWWLLGVVVSVVIAVVVLRRPGARRAAARGIGGTWARMEGLSDRAARRMRRSRAREARQLATSPPDDELLPDSVAVPGRWPYAHGGFMGAAPAMLADSRWSKTLAFLMPDVWLDVRDGLANRLAAHALIPMFENNPIACAFGHTRCADGERPDAIEWDIFFDGGLAEQWGVAVGPQREVLLDRLVDTMLIAHATRTDLVQEHVSGLDQFEDVRRTRKSMLGGVEAGAWLDLYARALQLNRSPDLRTAIATMAREPRSDALDEASALTFATRWSPQKCLEIHREVTGLRHLSVVLEMKSLRQIPGLLAAVVSRLNGWGVHVTAVGSFQPIAEPLLTQRLGDEIRPPPSVILFLHTVGDLQHACDRGKVPPRGAVMFNGASLLAPLGYAVDETVLDALEAYRVRFGLSLGIYVQESDCDPRAARQLAHMVRRRPGLFELGFAWGGLADGTSMPDGIGDHRGYGDQRVLARLGYAKPWAVTRVRTP